MVTTDGDHTPLKSLYSPTIADLAEPPPDPRAARRRRSRAPASLLRRTQFASRNRQAGRGGRLSPHATALHDCSLAAAVSELRRSGRRLFRLHLRLSTPARRPSDPREAAQPMTWPRF